MNKLHLAGYFLFLLFAISCKSQDCKNNNAAIIPLIESYIKYKNEKTIIDSKKNILLIGANTINNKDLSVSFYFINPQLLLNFNYSKVYSIKGYKMIFDESLNRTDILQLTFKNMEVQYENFNLGKIPFSYNTDYWNIIFNCQNEIIEILPQEKAYIIKKLLEKQKIKFSKDYID
ncbi:hypothetical protein WH221_18260 [Chryseobacterium culicis]|nr:hypothetical protein [Chryseobacterium culicis]